MALSHFRPVDAVIAARVRRLAAHGNDGAAAPSLPAARVNPPVPLTPRARRAYASRLAESDRHRRHRQRPAVFAVPPRTRDGSDARDLPRLPADFTAVVAACSAAAALAAAAAVRHASPLHTLQQQPQLRPMPAKQPQPLPRRPPSTGSDTSASTRRPGPSRRLWLPQQASPDEQEVRPALVVCMPSPPRSPEASPPMRRGPPAASGCAATPDTSAAADTSKQERLRGPAPSLITAAEERAGSVAAAAAATAVPPPLAVVPPAANARPGWQQARTACTVVTLASAEYPPLADDTLSSLRALLRNRVVPALAAALAAVGGTTGAAGSHPCAVPLGEGSSDDKTLMQRVMQLSQSVTDATNALRTAALAHEAAAAAQLGQLQQTVSRQAALLTVVTQQRDKALQALDSLRAQQTLVQEQIVRSEAAAAARVCQLDAAAESERAEHERRLAELQAQLAATDLHAQASAAKLQEARRSAADAVAVLNSQLMKVSTERDAERTRADAALHSVEAQQAALTDARKDIQAAASEAFTLRRELTRTASRAAAAERELADAREAISEQELAAAEARTAVIAAASEARQQAVVAAEATTRTSVLETQVGFLQQALDAARSQLHCAQAFETDASGTLRALRAEVQAARAQLERLQSPAAAAGVSADHVAELEPSPSHNDAGGTLAAASSPLAEAAPSNGRQLFGISLVHVHAGCDETLRADILPAAASALSPLSPGHVRQAAAMWPPKQRLKLVRPLMSVDDASESVAAAAMTAVQSPHASHAVGTQPSLQTLPAADDLSQSASSPSLCQAASAPAGGVAPQTGRLRALDCRFAPPSSLRSVAAEPLSPATSGSGVGPTSVSALLPMPISPVVPHASEGAPASIVPKSAGQVAANAAPPVLGSHDAGGQTPAVDAAPLVLAAHSFAASGAADAHAQPHVDTGAGSAAYQQAPASAGRPAFTASVTARPLPPLSSILRAPLTIGGAADTRVPAVPGNNAAEDPGSEGGESNGNLAEDGATTARSAASSELEDAWQAFSAGKHAAHQQPAAAVGQPSSSSIAPLQQLHRTPVTSSRGAMSPLASRAVLSRSTSDTLQAATVSAASTEAPSVVTTQGPRETKPPEQDAALMPVAKRTRLRRSSAEAPVAAAVEQPMHIADSRGDASGDEALMLPASMRGAGISRALPPMHGGAGTQASSRAEATDAAATMAAAVTTASQPREPTPPAWLQAAEAVASFPSDHLRDLCSSTHISDVVAVLAGAVCLLLGARPSWRQAVELMAAHDFG